MADQHTTGEVLIHLTYIREKQDEIVAHLTALNGRVGKTEHRLTVVETRADEAKNSAAKWGAGVGAGMSAIIAGLAQAFGWQK